MDLRISPRAPCTSSARRRRNQSTKAAFCRALPTTSGAAAAAFFVLLADALLPPPPPRVVYNCPLTVRSWCTSLPIHARIPGYTVALWNTNEQPRKCEGRNGQAPPRPPPSPSSCTFRGLAVPFSIFRASRLACFSFALAVAAAAVAASLDLAAAMGNPV